MSLLPAPAMTCSAARAGLIMPSRRPTAAGCRETYVLPTPAGTECRENLKILKPVRPTNSAVLPNSHPRFPGTRYQLAEGSFKPW
jgi:hypothetical protein